MSRKSNRRPRRRSLNVGTPNGWPEEMMHPDVWPWVCALWDYDYRDPEPLQRLIASGRTVPEPLRNAVNSATKGRRKRRSQSGVNRARITGGDRLRIAASLSNGLAALDVNKFNASRIADRVGEEPADILARNKRTRAEFLKEARDLLAWQSVKPETMEDLLRQLRDLADRWPNV